MDLDPGCFYAEFQLLFILTVTNRLFMLIVIMLNGIMVSVDMLNVVAPSRKYSIDSSGLYYKSFLIVIYNHNDSMIVIYDSNDSGLYYKTMIVAR
jgi:hypothetical protein